jgi:integrase
MKSGREHRVPLSDRALAILFNVGAENSTGFVFPGRRRGKSLAHNAAAHVVAHLGAASQFMVSGRASEIGAAIEPRYPREVIEAALAHTLGNSAEPNYRRSDALEKWCELMTAWSAFCEPSESTISSKSTAHCDDN